MFLPAREEIIYSSTEEEKIILEQPNLYLFIVLLTHLLEIGKQKRIRK